jgi:hypothetical protein
LQQPIRIIRKTGKEEEIIDKEADSGHVRHRTRNCSVMRIVFQSMLAKYKRVQPTAMHLPLSCDLSKQRNGRKLPCLGESETKEWHQASLGQWLRPFTRRFAALLIPAPLPAPPPAPEPAVRRRLRRSLRRCLRRSLRRCFMHHNGGQLPEALRRLKFVTAQTFETPRRCSTREKIWQLLRVHTHNNRTEQSD